MPSKRSSKRSSVRAKSSQSPSSSSTGSLSARVLQSAAAPSPNTADEAKKQLSKFIRHHLRQDENQGMVYTSEQIVSLLSRAREIFLSQKMMVRVRAPIKVVGDIHGQYTDLKRIFRAEGRPPLTKYIFLGDYVDRGKHSLECVMLLFSYKVLYPDSIVLLRGNHECISINRLYGFYDELQRRGLVSVFVEFNGVFDVMPMASLINGKILCMHGGISRELTNVDHINNIRRPVTMSETDCPTMAEDLLWADPDPNGRGFKPSPRLTSFVFGLDALEAFCKATGVECVVRGHQVVEKGFQRLGLADTTRIVTLFSAPNYCNEFDNSAAVMSVQANLNIQFSVLEPSADPTYRAEREKERATTPSITIHPQAPKR